MDTVSFLTQFINEVLAIQLSVQKYTIYSACACFSNKLAFRPRQFDKCSDSHSVTNTFSSGFLTDDLTIQADGNQQKYLGVCR
jgi:hypothetical protein